MIPEYSHKLNERVTLVHEAPAQGTGLGVTLLRISDETLFNFRTGVFEDYNSDNERQKDYTLEFSGIDFIEPELDNRGLDLVTATLLTLPAEQQDLMFIYKELNVPVGVGDEGNSFPYTATSTGTHYVSFDIVESGGTDDSSVQLTVDAVDGSAVFTESEIGDGTTSISPISVELIEGDVLDVSVLNDDDLSISVNNVSIDYVEDQISFYERHIFGGRPSVNEPTTCLIYGTLKDVSGKPLEGQKVEAYLNRAGFFTHKAGLIGYAATTLTNDSGYFELPLIVGLDVTINVPIIGFTQRGFVPSATQVELTSQTLLSYQPS